jgi:hypothetical protein
VPRQQRRLLADRREPGRDRRERRLDGLRLFPDGLRFGFGFLSSGLLGRERWELLEDRPSPFVEGRHRRRGCLDLLEDQRFLEIEDWGGLEGSPLGLRQGGLRFGDFRRRPASLGRARLGRHRHRRGRSLGRGGLGAAPLRLLGFFRLSGLLPLLTLPAQPDGSDLRVVERLERASGYDVHLFEQAHQLLSRDPELRR